MTDWSVSDQDVLEFWRRNAGDWWSGRLVRGTMGIAASRLADLLGISTADQKEIANDLAGIPLIGDVLVGDQQHGKIDDYLKNTGQTWADVEYPSLVNAGQNSIGRLFTTGKNFVSRNIYDLYR